MSIVLVGSTSGSVTLQEPAIAGTTVLTLPAVTGTVLTTTSPKAGNVLQVVSTTKTDTFTMASSTFTDITGLSVSITPSSSSSKILVLANVLHVGTVGTSSSGIRLVRDSTPISIGATAGNRSLTSGGANYGAAGTIITGDSVMFLDSPATTSSTTYKIQIKVYTSTAYVNRSNTDTDSQDFYRGTSSITVMEIAA